MLDEPTSGLDPDAEWNLMKLLAEHARDHGQTILVITHTLNTIHFCGDAIFLENARKRATGTPLEVLEALEKGISQTQPDTSSGCDVSIAKVRPEKEVAHAQSDTSVFSRWAKVFGKFKTDEDKTQGLFLLVRRRVGVSR